MVSKTWFYTVGLFLLFCQPAEVGSAAFVTYNIGNSLTGNLVSPPERLPALAVSGSQQEWSVGYQVRGNSSLTSFVNSPYLPALDYLSPSGTYTQAFASTHIDALILQPFLGATVRQELDAAKLLINQFRSNSINANSRVLIYATWGANDSVSFQQRWDQQGATLDSLFSQSSQVYDLFMQELRITVPNAEIIPVGHVFDAVVDKINSPDGLPGLTSVTQLIGDGVHASNAGGYLAGITAYSTLYGTSPIGLDYPAGYQNPAFGFILPSSAIPIVQQIALSTVAAVPEPNSLMSIGLGLIAYASRTRHRISKKTMCERGVIT